MSMRKPLISIIVPVYNVETYIDQCIKSVITQTFTDYELILVNDGSTDHSLERCMHWKSDERVKIISTENKGVSHARNIGLQSAIGQWILFLDSDDYLIEGSLQKIIMYTEYDVQEIAGLFAEKEVLIGEVNKKIVSADEMKIMSLDSINNKLLPAFYNIKEETLMGCWGKLYLNEIIQKNNIIFHEDLRLSEDLLFHLDYLSCIDKVLVTDVPVFVYRKVDSSVTHSFKKEYLNDRLLFWDKAKIYESDSFYVHIVRMMFQFICKVEKSTSKSERKELEQTITESFEKNKNVLYVVKNKSLSGGKWQKIVYKLVLFFFICNMEWLAYRTIKLYTLIAKGEI